MIRRAFLLPFWIMVLLLGVCICAIQADEPSVSAALLGLPVQNLVNEFCLDCHSSDDPTADLDLESVSLVAVSRNSEFGKKPCGSCGRVRCRLATYRDRMNQLMMRR